VVAMPWKLGANSITRLNLNPPIHEVHGIPMRHLLIHGSLPWVFSAPCSRLSQLFFKPMYLRRTKTHRSGWLQRGILSAQHKHGETLEIPKYE